MKMTRRGLATAAATAAALAQTPPSAPTPSSGSDELLRAAREQVKRNGDALARFNLPMAVEPAFQFKA